MITPERKRKTNPERVSFRSVVLPKSPLRGGHFRRNVLEPRHGLLEGAERSPGVLLITTSGKCFDHGVFTATGTAQANLSRTGIVPRLGFKRKDRSLELVLVQSGDTRGSEPSLTVSTLEALEFWWHLTYITAMFPTRIRLRS